MSASLRSRFLARLWERVRGQGPTAVLYFHSPCFDGIVSAVIAWDFAEAVLEWRVRDLQSVNYDRRSSWLSGRLSEPCAVVDFLYHPQATFWADHHSTTFLSAEAERDFGRRRSNFLIYDGHADACAQLLWDRLDGDFQYRNPRYAELVAWATKTDAARYSSVREAIEGTAPALRINGSLAHSGEESGYSAWLVRQLRRESLEAVANLPEVCRRYERFRLDIAKGLALFKERARLDHGVVVFDVDAADAIVPRYAPYYFFPDARYSAGMIRRGSSTTITAMRNPWRESAGVHLGKMFESLGGGGHERVGSVVLRGADASRAEGVFDQLLDVLQQRRDRRVSGSYSR